MHLLAGTQLDSLRHELSAVSDRNKVDVLIQIGDSLQYIDPSSALTHYETAVDLARLIGDKSAIAESLGSLGNYKYGIGKYQESIEAEMESLQYFKLSNDSAGMANAHMGLGIAYSDIALHQLAMEHYLESKAIYEELHDETGLAYLYLNLGCSFNYLKDYDLSNEYYHKAEKLFQQLNLKEEYADVLQNLGSSYSDKGNEIKAYAYYRDALQIYEKHEFLDGWMLCLANAGLTLASLDSLDLGLEMLEKSIVLSKRAGDLSNLAYALNSKGQILTQLKRYKEADLILKEALELATENDFIEEIKENHLLRSDLFHATGDQLYAYIHRVWHDEIKDSLEFLNSIGSINSQMMAYETEKRDHQIKLLQAQREQELLNEEKSYSKFWVIFIVMGLILIGAALIYYSYNKKKKSEALLKIKQRELTQINLKLEEEKQMAEKATNSKAEFLSMMTHELRTPLNAVIGIANVLEAKNRNEEDDEALRTLKFASNNLLSLINDILDFNKLESGNVLLEEVNFDLTKMLQNIRMSFQMDAAKKNIHFSVHRSQNVPQMICGDPTRLTQILTNLVSNALKFTQQGFVRLYVELVHSKSGEYRIRFVVKDTGIGIPKEKQAAIFDSFQQAESSTTRKFGGSGLGLSICKRIIEISGGSLNVESEPGLGSTFLVELPFKATQKNLPDSASALDEEALKNMKEKIAGLKILIVDDNEMNIFVAKSILGNLQIATKEALSGHEAIDLIEEGEVFDLVLLDLQMPGIDGFETSKRIKTIQSTLPVVALTASSKEEVSFNGRSENFNGFLRKPFEIEHLVEMIYFSSKPMQNHFSE